MSIDISDAFKMAAASKSQREQAERMARIAETMRFDMGMNYQQCLAAALKSGVPAERWEHYIEAVDYDCAA
jgi:predicted solute-binding protein